MVSDGLLQALASLNLAIGAGVTILIALLLLQRQRRPLKFLVVTFYLLMAYGLVTGWLARSGLMAAAPYLLFTTYIISFAHGPVVYLYTERLLSRTARFRPVHLVLFLPAVLMIGVVASYHLAFPVAAAQALRARSPFPPIEQPVLYAICAAADFSVAFYLVLAGIKVNSAARASRPPRADGLRVFFWLYLAAAATYLAVLVGHMVADPAVTMIASTANGFSALAYFLYIHQRPDITQRSLRIAAAVGRPSAGRPEQGAADIAARLEALMVGELMYREPELTLRDVSDALGVTTNRLSAAVNTGSNRGFRAYVNALRLKEARELLASEDASSILEIAYAVGFNSKTAFNTLFTRETGLTPTEYRRACGRASTDIRK